MKISQKLKIIQTTLGVTQSKLAIQLGVSPVTLNSWLTEKSEPRTKIRSVIDELFLEITGQKVIPETLLTAKKQIIRQKSKEYKNLVQEILNNPDIHDQFILKLTYHSNSIEGSTLTERDTSAVLFDNTALPHRTLTEQLEAKNHQVALEYVFEHLHKKRKIDTSLVLKLHSILMNGVRKDAGSYRNHGVRITGVPLATANYVSVPLLVEKIMTKANSKVDDIVYLSTVVHSTFEQIHPFSDGNGRIGRLIMCAMLLRVNIAPAIIRQEKKQLYYTYLYKAQTKNDTSQFEDFICDAITDGFRVMDRREIL